MTWTEIRFSILGRRPWPPTRHFPAGIEQKRSQASNDLILIAIGKPIANSGNAQNTHNPTAYGQITLDL